jgi:aminoglycoside phosphotransferase (APT) family kinase protein
MTDVPGLDLDRLRAYLDKAAPALGPGPLTAEVVAGGKSNLTYFMSAPETGAQWVLRRPPLGHVLATAHDMTREYRVLSALGPTAVPVPRTLLLCADPEVLGAPFYLMERVDGTVYRGPDETAALTPQRAATISYALIDVLADLHDVDPATVGLGDFGRPEGFLDRQLARWGKQLAASRSRDLPGIDELHADLAANVPASGPAAIVHGDYRLDNVIVGADDRVSAVLDWEMATLGDPLTDLGLMLVYWDALSSLPANALPKGVSADAGFPIGEQLIERYAERRPVDLSRLGWYLALGFFKLAVIAEGIHFRFTQGQTVGAGFAQMGEAVIPLVTQGRAVLRTEGDA